MPTAASLPSPWMALQGEGLDGGAPVGVEGGGGVEEAGELAFAEDAEGVAEPAGGVVEVAARVVAAVGDELVGGLVEGGPELGQGHGGELGLGAVPAGEVAQHSGDGAALGGGERDVLGADEAADQGEPAGEEDGAAAVCLGGVEVGPAVSERSGVEGVDASGEAGADAERVDAEGAGDVLVLVLDVAEDQGAVAEADHPEQEGLDQGALAAAGFAEDEDVGVGDGDGVVGDPAHRVAVEGSSGEDVEPHRGAGGWQSVARDQGPQHRGLVGGDLVAGQGWPGGRPAVTGPAAPAGWHGRGEHLFDWCGRWRDGYGGQGGAGVA